MQTELFDYELPPALIAQQPAQPRDNSRLLVLHRADGRIEHRHFREIGDYLHAGDLLVANNSRVIPARLHGRKATGGQVEIFLLRQQDAAGQEWDCLVRGRKLDVGVKISLEPSTPDVAAAQSATPHAPVEATILAVYATGTRCVRFSVPIQLALAQFGEIPLPPYITEYVGDRERYQTIYSQPEGSVAAPTAGLHFTPDLLLSLRHQEIGFETVTLHVGLDTFRPVEAARIEDHQIHTEWAELNNVAARHINDTTLQGGRIVAVGTTATRTLEWAATGAQNLDPYDATACPWQRVAAFAGNVNLFIHPGYRFCAVDSLITNFHLPRSSLLMLVSAFVGQATPDDLDAGRRLLLHAYAEAKRLEYRFFSFGDAMLIL